MNDEIELKLPISGKVVIIRSYTTASDDQVSEQILYDGIMAEQNGKEQSIKFPLSNVMASEKVYIPRLVKSIDGDTNVNNLLGELRTPDYAAISEAVGTIVEQDSPKAKAAKTAATKSLKAK